MTKLLIVESPAKCKKIQEFLGDGWRVQATMGHIRALKEELAAIGFNPAAGTQQNWNPTYESIKTKADAISSLRRTAASAEVYLGSDDDREGEAIAWHVCQLLHLDPATTPRVVFHEITAPAIQSAVANPRRIDFNKFNAQQARSMLDMLIGFTLSPCLWRGVGHKPGLSAGRCQTPALRLIYDRDREIEGHAASNTWRLQATTEDCIEDSTLEWRDATVYPTAEAVTTVLNSLTGTTSLTVRDRTERVATSQPPKPFITSTLQQEASNRLGMQPKTTMKAAQTLYEAGHITYMRTDSPVLSQEASDAASALVAARWGEEFLGNGSADDEGEKKTVKKKTKAKSKKAEAEVQAQNAHEGIRPTHFEVDSSDQLEGMGAAERRLYDLIWRRTIQSVMAPEKRDVVKLSATPTSLAAPVMTTEWEQVRFAGWRILDHEKRDAEETAHEAAVFEARADLQPGTELEWSTFVAAEIRSSPPSRYTEASLIRELEHRGIGRPSTYATLVETVLDRGYVERATITAQPVKLKTLTLKVGAAAPKMTERTEKVGGEKDKLRTTALGRTVIEWLLGQFGDMLEYDFTAGMETKLDEVARGVRSWDSVLTDAWTMYAERYATVMQPRAVAAGGGMTADRLSTGMSADRLSTSVAGSSGNRIDFGDGYKLVVSKKGPLFVLERDGEKTRFASVPPTLSLETATRADAEAAFAAPTGDTVGEFEGHPVVRRKGPYGFYAQWKTVRINCKESDTLEELITKIKEKMSPDTIDHTVGPFKIRKGQYGLYMFKTGTTGKPQFVNIPDTTDWAALTVEGAEALYKSGGKSAPKRAAARAPKEPSGAKEPAEPKKRAPRKKATDRE